MIIVKSILLNIEYFLYFFTIAFSSLYVFNKLCKTKFSKKKRLVHLVIIILVSLISVIIKSFNSTSEVLFIILIIVFLTIIDTDKKSVSFSKSVISVGITYGIEFISTLVVPTFFWLLNIPINTIVELSTDIFNILLIILIFRIQRIKSIYSVFNNIQDLGMGLFISGLTLFFIFTATQYSILPTFIIPIFIICGSITFIGLVLWIRSAITKHYRKRLKLRAEEYSKIELAEKQEEIEKLTNENTSLSSIIHLDNHIIQSIESELKALNNSELADKLLTSINQRNEYVNDLLIKSKNLASTGNAEIDAVLLDLYIKSASRGIDYNLSADCDINYLLNNIISVSDFEALLRNLITNSIVDIENNPDIPGRISIKISQPNDIYELTVMDNGVFNDNNSIPDIVEKSNASILINKFNNNDSFTKSVTIRFDGLKIHC